jgi:hypothetical protein
MAKIIDFPRAMPDRRVRAPGRDTWSGFMNPGRGWLALAAKPKGGLSGPRAVYSSDWSRGLWVD